MCLGSHYKPQYKQVQSFMQDALSLWKLGEVFLPATMMFVLEKSCAFLFLDSVRWLAGWLGPGTLLSNIKRAFISKHFRGLKTNKASEKEQLWKLYGLSDNLQELTDKVFLFKYK